MEDEYPPWNGFDGADESDDAAADDAMLQDNSSATHPVQPATPTPAAVSIMDDVRGTREDSSEVDSPPPRRYGTRPANVDRRPGKDLGLNWKADKLEREAAEAAQAQKKSEAAAKKQDKLQRTAHEEAGVQKLAALEAARMRADREDRARVDERTAHAYRAPLADAIGDSNDYDGDHNNTPPSPSPNTGSRTQSTGKVRQPCCISCYESLSHTTVLQKPPVGKQSAAEKRRDNQTTVRERIINARPNSAGEAHPHGDLHPSPQCVYSSCVISIADNVVCTIETPRRRASRPARSTRSGRTTARSCSTRPLQVGPPRRLQQHR